LLGARDSRPEGEGLDDNIRLEGPVVYFVVDYFALILIDYVRLEGLGGDYFALVLVNSV
jgi:hypothetical protein